jgi:CBS domain containing-hemolysin-like protein
MGQLVLAVLILLTLSALASGAEVALFAVPYSQVLTAHEEGRRGSHALKRVKEQMARPIMAIVVWNNVSNIVGAIGAGVFGDKWLGVFSAVLTMMVILFAEITPKTLGERYAERIALLVAPPVLVLSRLMTPLLWCIEQFVRPFVKDGATLSTSEEEIQALTRLGRQTGVIEADESELIQRVFRLNDVTAGDILTPTPQLDALDCELNLAEAREQVLKVTHTRLPIYKPDNPGEIIGVVNVRDLLAELAQGRDTQLVTELASEPSFVPETMVGDDLLRHFQATKQHLAVVVNGMGTVLGVVTLEDVIEELVGEIIDETDVERVRIQRISPEAVRVQAMTDIREINRILGSQIPDEGRIGERVIEELGRIPAEGESFPMDGLHCTVEDATPRGIRWLKLEKLALDEGELAAAEV